ncbi:MAG: hypothetical protein ACJAVK_002874 [Akkermansiaceae bacterium]|jgi:hypothetical protein
MICFVLNRPGQQAVRFDHDRSAIEQFKSGTDLGRTSHFRINAIDTEAAFTTRFPLFAEFKDRIDENQRHQILQSKILTVDPEIANTLGVMRNINNRHLNLPIHLRRGQSDSFGMDHGRDKILPELSKIVSHLGDFATFLAEDRISILGDFKDHD